MLERLYLRPELLPFEQLVRKRVSHLAVLDDDRFARPTSVERDSTTGELVVVAEFINGSRMSDLLDTAADTSVVPGVDVALGYLLESLTALSTLHTIHRVTHGLIAPSRTMVTAEGQVVFLDVTFGSAVERLDLSRTALWTQFGVGSPTGTGSVRFDPAADITQVALSALMLILGRNLYEYEYPDALPTLLMEVIEVAQIRGTSGFAGGLQRFLQRTLPIPGRRPHASADEALVDIRQLVRREIGMDVCRQAVVDFVANMEAAFSASAGETAHAVAARPATPGNKVPELDAFLDNVDIPAATPHSQEDEQEVTLDDATEGEEEVELSLDSLGGGERREPSRTDHEEVYDLPALDTHDLADLASVDSTLSVSARRSQEARRFEPAPPPARESFFAPPVREPEPELPPVVLPEPEPVYAADPEPTPAYTEFTSFHDEEPVHAPVVEPTPEPVFAALDEPPAESRQPEPEPALEPLIAPPEPEPAIAAAPATAPPADLEPAQAPEAEAEKETGSWRRKKRQQQKSARARKDKLRSTTTVQKLPTPVALPEPAVARPASPTGWLVAPQRAAAFDPPVPDSHPLPVPAARPAPPPMPAVPSFSPSPVGPLPQPVYAPKAPTPVYGSPTVVPVVHPSPLAPPVPMSAPGPTQVKVRANPPIGFTPPKKQVVAEPPTMHVPMERSGTMAPLGLNRSDDAEEEPRGFPWKLAAIAVVVAAIAIVAGRSYLPGRPAVAGEPGAQAPATSQAAAPAAPAEDAPETPIPSGRGRLVITTQPAGIKVLIDRRPAGETPLKVDLAPGKHVLSFMTTGGEVMRSVRVVGGKSATLDLPVFSGWVAIFAPVVLDIAENGKSIGTTEQNRLMLPPGRHQLTVSNKELGYSSVQDVEVEPGGVKSVNVDAKGTVSLNAAPWAEVWLDDKKLGDTPLVTQVPLGTREFVFKHPQHGERRITATIKATGPVPVSVDFTK